MTVRDGLCDAIGIKMRNWEETGVKSLRMEAVKLKPQKRKISVLYIGMDFVIT